VDEYLSEREQVDRISQWVKQNGPWIVAGIVAGALALAGWNWWQAYKLRQAEEASGIYSVLAEAAMGGRIDEARAGLDRLSSEYRASPYLAQGRLALAAALVRSGDFEAAITQLDTAMSDARDPQLKLLARLRLARLLAAEGDEQRALRLVDDVDAGAFTAALLEVKGDVLAARGDVEGAREAYRQALDGSGRYGGVIDEEFVRLKLEALQSGAPTEGDAS
jgi:predicted negative regulator of RcsB-dependent stress response